MELSDFTGQWDYGTLSPNVELGPGCYLESRESFKRFDSRRERGLVLGRRVRAHAWTEFTVGRNGRLEVGDDSVLVGAIFMCHEHIAIGARVVISYNVLIADSDMHPRDPDLRRRDAVGNAPFGNKSTRPPLECRPVVIEDDVSIGIGAIVLKGVRIGAGACVAPGAVVARNVPPRAHAAGNPATPVEGTAES